MNRPRRVSAVFVIVSLLVSLLPAGGLAAQEPPPPVAAYIWRSDVAAADGYKSLIEAAGFEVTVLHADDVADADLSVFDLFVVGSDTGYAYEWGPAGAVRALRDARRPILGLGYGGACLFGRLGLSIEWGNGWVGPETRLIARDPAHPVFTTPYAIDLAADGGVTVYTASDHIGEYAPELSATVELIAYEPASEDHYPLVREGRAVLWGFTGSPYALTPAGEQLFINTVAWTGTLGSASELLPDLVVSDVWLEGTEVCYQLCNLGDGPAEAGHTTAVLRDGAPFATDAVDVVLGPGERQTRSLRGEWHLADEPEVVRVIADADDVVLEHDEANAYEETWRADTEPPRITAGPAVSAITQTSAVVSIQTDEPSQARVRWGTAAGVLDSGLLSEEYATAHTFTLAGLDAATTYQFVVSCADEAGNRMMGELLTFQTLPPAETIAPEIAILEMPMAEWPSRLLVDATDDSGIASVRLAVDGVEQAVDYSAPFEFMWDPSRYTDGTHMVDITAVDVAGNESQDTMAIDALSVHDPDRPITTIFAPVKDSTVAGTITVRASITDDVGIRSVAMMVDGYTRGYIEYPAPYPNAPVAEFTLDTTTLEKGKHSIAVLASDGTWRSTYGSELDLIGIWVDNPPPAPPPKLAVVHRWVKRLGTHFMVAVTVKNTGGQEARNARIIDPVTAFQPVSADTALARYAAVWPTGASANAHMEISPRAAIPPGQTRTYTYLLVPFMTGDGSITAMIGNPETTLRWESPTLPGTYTSYTQAVATTDSDGIPVYVSHAIATLSSKHLIVTSPGNLRQYYGAAGADTVLSTSAELAVERGGVLGYLDLPSRFPRQLEAEDRLAVGPLSGTGVDEFVIGDVSAKRIYVARVAESTAPAAGGAPGAAGAQISRWEERDLTGTEAFGAGDGIAFFRRGPSGPMGVAWADASANTVSLLNANGNLAAMRTIPFDDGDTLACGDITGDGRDEIFVFRPGMNQVLVYKVLQLTDPMGVWVIEPHNTFAWDIEVRDCIAMGDVWGDTKAEIVIGDVSAQKMFVLEGNGSVVHQPTRIVQEGDRMAVGQPAVAGAAGGSDKDLIVHGKKSTGYAVWTKPTGAGVHVLANAGFEKGDLLAAGRFTAGALRDSAVVGSVQENGLELHDPGESGPEVLRSLLAGSEVYIPFVLSDIEPAGAWSKRLHPSWVKNGALTIVGESEIVPSWGNRVFGKVYSNMGGAVAWRQLRADITDYPYASTVGDEIVPELACGRVIGNSAEELCKPMRASIAVARGEPGHGFDRSDVLLVSGFDAGMNGGAAPIDFYSEASGVNKALAWLTGDNRAHMHTPNFVVKKADGSIDEAATRDSIASTFLGLATDTDIVFLAGHGSAGAWDEVAAQKILDEADPFGAADPVVYAAACNTGNYTHPTSFANAMLARGAAAYIGATTWGLSTHSWIANSFFNTWRTGTSAGQAMREVRREVAYLTVPGSSFSNQYTYPDKYAQYWSGIYHLYGDPLFGAEGLASTSGASSSQSQTTFTSSSLGDPLEEGSNAIEVSIPDYEVSSTATGDRLEIPGGQMLVENARPQVPVLVVTREVPKGFSVGDVSVAERSEPVLQGGVDLPPLLDAVVGDEWGVHPVDPPALAEDSWGRDWWPAAECSWKIVEGVDSDTLAVTLFPVDYSMRTQDLRFFKHWTLQVDVHEAPVRIDGAKTRAATYPAGSPVTLDVALAANEGAPDVTIEAAVRDISGEALGGFPVRTLNSPGPHSALSLLWEPEAAAAGACIAEVVVRGPDGRVFDSATAEFTLGAPLVRADSLTARPEHYTPGQAVDVSLGVANEGDISAEGTAVLTVLDASGAEVVSLREDFEGLAAGTSRVFDFAWDTAGLAPGIYTAHGLVHYGGRVSNVLTLQVASATPHADAGPDQTVERDSLAGASVTLDGSGSFNPDGDSLTYGWTWEGGIATGVSPIVVLPMGTTSVTLTVSDGTTTDTDTVDVLVVDTTAPELSITVPAPGDALQDGVTLAAHASDLSGVAGVWFTLRADDGGSGVPVGCESMPAAIGAGTPADGTWTLPFDTSALADGAYTVSARALDAYGNEARTQVLAFTVRNWALVELLPASARYQPGRTVPIKFTVRVSEAVDLATPFIYNEELEVRIYDTRWPSTPLQVSRFGPKARDYRIDTEDELYITNFATAKKPASYLVEVWRPAGGLLVGSFGFVTAK